MNVNQLVPAVLVVAALSAAAHAGTIEQSGIVSGGLGGGVHDVVLDQFDDQGGTLQLKSVTLDFLTSIIGGYTTDGSGIPVHIFAQLDADWSLNGSPLGETQALIDTVVANTNSNSVTVFNTDTDSTTLTSPADLAAWIGNSTITMQATTNFQVFEDPAGIIDFGAGGTVRYTVTYDFNVVPAPGAAAMLSFMLIASRRRRR